MNKKNIVWGLIFIMAAILVVCGAFGILGNPVNLIITVLLIPIIISNVVHVGQKTTISLLPFDSLLIFRRGIW